MEILEKPCKTATEVFEELQWFHFDSLGWIFRGQRKASWQLRPLLERNVPLEDLPTAELQLFDDFRAKAHLYTTTLPQWGDVVSWLAAMQHHGVPTRLLDWTYSAFVALYFAVEKEEPDPACDAAVWAIDRRVMQQQVKEATQNLFQISGDVRFSDPRRFRQMAFRADTETNIVNMAFEDRPEAGLVCPLLPLFQSQRLSAQQGLFLFNYNYKIAFEQSLGALLAPVQHPVVRKIVFPSSLRRDLLRRLFGLNIHPVSMFPDIGGLGSFIRLKQELFGWL